MSCTFVPVSAKYSTKKLTPTQVLDNLVDLDEIISYESNPLNYVDQAQIKTTLSAINAVLPTLPITDYVYLRERLEQSPIPNIEFADIAQSAAIDTTNLPIISIPVSNSAKTLLKQMDDYYQGDMSTAVSGGMCSLYMNQILVAAGLIDTAIDLISDIANFSFAETLQQLADLVYQTIDQVVASALGIINNIIKRVSNLGKTFNLIMKKVREVQNIFTEEGVKGIKDRVGSILARLGSQFKSNSAEILAFIMFKGCQIAGAIHNLLMGSVDDLSNIVSRAENGSLALTTMSSKSSASAIEAGAIRLTPEVIRVGRQNAAYSINSNAGVASPISPTKYVSLPADDFEKNLVATLTDAGNQFVQFSPNVINMHKEFPSSNPANNIPGAGWKMVKPDVWLLLFRVADRMGKKFYINSGYRNENKNSAVGGASNSYHMSGMAIDVSMSGVNREQFIQYCSQEGFGGIGVYSSFIHVDIGPRRTWGTGGGNEGSMLSMHQQDRFRKG